MPQTKSMGQTKAVDITRGLFVIRYGAAEDEFHPPKVTVGLATGVQDVEFVLHPDAQEPVLWKPGTSLVVRAATPTKLQIEVTPSREGGSMAANVKVEQLTQGVPADLFAGAAAAATGLNLNGLKVLGHVAGIGDVMVGANQWIAGPSAPSRIEGIAVNWPNKPHDLDLRYAVRIARAQAAQSRMMEIGTYAGTRGQAVALTGVIIELSGTGSGNHQICADAAFLGSPTMRVMGKRIVLTGPTGREPLVGLRLTLEAINSALVPEAKPAVAAPISAPSPVEAAPKRASRVRVFRSRSKEEQSP
jgi:hypothetical protein